MFPIVNFFGFATFPFNIKYNYWSLRLKYDCFINVTLCSTVNKGFELNAILTITVKIMEENAVNSI